MRKTNTERRMSRYEMGDFESAAPAHSLRPALVGIFTLCGIVAALLVKLF